MVFVIGDLHRDPQTLMNIVIEYKDELSKEDYVIVCGDFGFIWAQEEVDNKWLDLINTFPFTTLFIDGNHENFTRLNSYPIVEWHGGKAHQIRSGILHLMRGEVFEIEGDKYFCFGGARSIDKAHRIMGSSWWPEEEPNWNEYNNAEKNLEAIDWQPDYIITHDMPQFYIKEVYSGRENRTDKTRAMLNNFLFKCYGYKKWYCGHHHMDVGVRDNFQICFKKIYRIEE